MFFSRRKIDWDEVRRVTAEVLKQNHAHTPDQKKLSFARKQWLFLCDEFQLGHTDYERLPITIFRYYGFTFKGFFMFKTNMNPEVPKERQRRIYPVLMEGKDYHTVPRLKVKGQMHLVEPDVLYFLDKEKKNGILFDRTRVQVEVFFRVLHPNGIITRGRSRIWAWTYIGRASFWEPYIDNGYMFKPVRRFLFKPDSDKITSLGTYYCWTKMEYHGF